VGERGTLMERATEGRAKRRKKEKKKRGREKWCERERHTQTGKETVTERKREAIIVSEGETE